MDGLPIVSLKSYPSDDTQIHNPHSGTSGEGGGGRIPPSVFDMLQYWETILPSVESL